MSALPSSRSRPNVFEIDLDAIAGNVEEIRRFVGPGVRLFVAMKANAYGFGLLEVAQVLQDRAVDGICVADVADAGRLRAGGIELPILLYAGSSIDVGFVEAVERLGISVTVNSVDAALTIERLAANSVSCFVKVDSGLERLGIPAEEAARALRDVARLPHLRVAGIYTHLHVPGGPTADAYVDWQLARFREVAEGARLVGIDVPTVMAASTPVVPIAGSAGFNAIDVGRLVYGSLREGQDRTGPMRIRNAFGALRSRLVQCRPLVRREHLAEAPFAIRPGMRIGVVPMGYADGLESLNCGEALVRGRRVPLLGACTLEHTRIDLTEVPDAAVGDEVVFVGRQGDVAITPDEVMEHLGMTQPARMATAVRESVSRVYVRTTDAG